MLNILRVLTSTVRVEIYFLYAINDIKSMTKSICTAYKLESQKLLNGTGPLFIKEMPGLTLVAGSAALIPCMYGGFPVDQILWQKNGEDLVKNMKARGGRKGRYSVLSNGTLKIEQINTGEDKGQYTCVISNRKGEVASGTVDVNVMRK